MISGRPSTPWKCVVLVPFEHTIEFARDIATAQTGAESVRQMYKNVISKDHTFYPMIAEISGPPEVIAEYAKTVAPPEPPPPVQLVLPLPEPPDGPRAA